MDDNVCNERHKQIEGWLKRLESRQETVEMELEAVKISHAGTSEQIRTIFSMIAEIKTLLEKYTDKMAVQMGTSFLGVETRLRALEGRSGRFFDGAIKSLVAALIAWAIGYFMSGAKP